jgi:hypothetical protein
MGSGMKKADAAMSTSVNGVKSAFGYVVSADAGICRITGAGHRPPPERTMEPKNRLPWAFTRTVS